jgi:FkbM family methyltransferase
MLAHHKGAKSILAYEPDEDSFRLLSMNSYEMKNIIPIRAAVVAHHDKTTDFYKSTSGKNPGNYSTTKFEGRLHTKVPSVNFGDVLIGFRPEVIKFDCEGEEYSLLTEYELPNQVRQVVMEVHLNKPQWRNSVGSILNIFKDWEAVRPPRYTPKSWHFVAGWRR